MNPLLLSRARAVELMGVHTRTLDREIQRGTGLRIVRIGRRILIRPNDFDDWLTRRAEQTAAKF